MKTYAKRLSVVRQDIDSIANMHHFIANNADADILYISAHGHYDRKKNLAGIIIGDQFLISIDFPWTFANLCGTVVYCKGGAKMAQISLEELYRGEGAGESYGILGEYDLRHLCNHGTGARYGCQNALGNHRPCVICNYA